MNWREVIKSTAPTLGGLIGTAVAGPAGGALASTAIVAIGNALGVPMTGDTAQDEGAIEQVVRAGMTPEQTAALVAADLDYKTALVAADVRKVEVAAEVTKAYIGDAADARTAHANNVWVMRLAVGINVLSYLLIGGVLIGCFLILTQTVKVNLDPGTATMVGGLIGGAVQWVLQNAGQANSFAFGSSPSSRAVSESLSKAVSNGVVKT